MLDNEIPKHRGSKKYKSKPIILQARYIGNSKQGQDMFDGGKWFPWGKYRDVDTANQAKRVLGRKWKNFAFRIKP